MMNDYDDDSDTDSTVKFNDDDDDTDDIDDRLMLKIMIPGMNKKNKNMLLQNSFNKIDTILMFTAYNYLMQIICLFYFLFYMYFIINRIIIVIIVIIGNYAKL